MGAIVAGTYAYLADSSTSATIAATGVTVDVPTGLSVTDTGSAVQVGFTPPTGGDAPTGYEIFRRDGAGAYPGTPIQSVAAPPWDDTSVVACSTYYYKVRSVHDGILGDFTDELPVVYGDSGGAPQVSRSAVVGTSGLTSASDIDDYFRPGGEFYVYAEVADPCAEASSITTIFELDNMIGAPTAAPATFGSYSAPDGLTYNFRAGPFTADAGIAHGDRPTWRVDMTDPGGQHRNSAGTRARADANGPNQQSAPQIVSAATNYYSTTIGYGEIAQNSSFYAYGRYTDTNSGLGLEANAVQVDATNIASGVSDAALVAGSYGTDNNINTWTFRSAAINTDASLSEGVVQVTVTAYDRVGNSTAANVQVEVDNTALGLTSCTALNGNGTLRQNDANVLDLNDSLDPESVGPGWNGNGNYTFDIVVVDGGGANDYADFGLLGTLDLHATSWVAADRTFANSRLALLAPDQLRVQFRGGSNTAVQSTAGTLTWGSATDIAGNPGAGTVACSTDY